MHVQCTYVHDALSLHVQNLEYFQAEEGTPNWQRYLDYLDDIIVDGLFNCIHCSLHYLLVNTDKEGGLVPPLLEVKLELQVRVGAGQAVGLSSWVSLTPPHAPVIICNLTPHFLLSLSPPGP